MGAGINLFKTLFPSDYYPYTANTLMSAKPTGKKIVGFNQWDEEYANGYFNASTGVFVEDSSNTSIASKNYIKAIGGATYCLKQPTSSQPQIYQYDSEKNFISRITGISIPYGTFTLNSNTAYIKFICFNYGAGIYNNDICLNISDNAKNGTYEPYSETTIIYSGNELRGLLKVGTNGLYADGDTDDGSGSTDIIYAEENTDNVTFEYNGDNKWLMGALPNCDQNIDWNPEAISDLPYTLVNSNVLSSNDKSWTLYGGKLFIRDTTKTENELRSIIADKKIVYLRQSPTTATSTAWSNPIVAKEGGTEEFTDSRSIALPTGHSTIYGTDLSVKKAEFGTTVFGGSVDFTTGEVISDKNADGTDKTAETISISPVMVGVFEGDNNIVTTAGGNNTVKYYKGA